MIVFGDYERPDQIGGVRECHTAAEVIEAIYDGLVLVRAYDGSDVPRTILRVTSDNLAEALSGLDDPPWRTGLTVALLGASITQENSHGAGIYDDHEDSPATYAYGAFAWANALLGQRLTLLKNAGVGGQPSAGIAARVDDIIDLPVRPDFCIIADWFTNDLDGNLPTDTPADDIIANGEEMVSKLMAAGIRPVLCTVLPCNQFNTTSRKTSVSKANAWVRSQAANGVIVVDAAPYFATATTGLPKTGVTRDGTHMTNLGGELAGIALADALRPYVGGAVDLVTSAVDTNSLSANPQMAGTGGTKGSGMTGSVATGWNAAWSGAAGTAQLAKVSRTDHIDGEWQQIRMTATGQLWFQTIVASGFADGDKIQLEAEWQADNDWTDISMFQAYLLDSTGRTSNDLYVTDVVPQSYVWPGASGILRTPPMVVNAGAAYLAGQIVIQGASGTVRIGRARIKKV